MENLEAKTIVLSIFNTIIIVYLIIKLFTITQESAKCLMYKKGITVHGGQYFFCLGTGTNEIVTLDEDFKEHLNAVTNEVGESQPEKERFEHT